MTQGVRVVIKGDGKVQIEWNGFQGESCYLEAQKLYATLKGYGVDVEIKEIKPKTDLSKEQKVAVANSQMEMSRW